MALLVSFQIVYIVVEHGLCTRLNKHQIDGCKQSPSAGSENLRDRGVGVQFEHHARRLHPARSAVALKTVNIRMVGITISFAGIAIT